MTPWLMLLAQIVLPFVFTAILMVCVAIIGILLGKLISKITNHNQGNAGYQHHNIDKTHRVPVHINGFMGNSNQLIREIFGFYGIGKKEGSRHVINNFRYETKCAANKCASNNTPKVDVNEGRNLAIDSTNGVHAETVTQPKSGGQPKEDLTK